MRKVKLVLCLLFSVLSAVLLLSACGGGQRPGGEEKQAYTVTLVYNDGVTPDKQTEMEEGHLYELPAASSRKGYSFAGWKAGDTLYAVGNTYLVNAAVTFTAQWEKLYSVTYNLAGGEGSFAHPDTKAGATVTLPATDPMRDGYEFGGWRVNYTDGSQTVSVPVEQNAFVMPAYNVTVTARWTQLFTVTYDLAGGTGSYSQPDTKAGATVTLPATDPTRTGYVFDGWYVNSNKVTGSFAMPANNVTIVARWAQLYTVTYDLAGGTGSYSQPDTKAGATVTLPATDPTRTGFIFEGWYLESNKVTGSFVMPANNVTVMARWAQLYTVTYDLAGGTGSYTQPDTKAGATVTLPATDPVRTGYTFDGWYVNSNKVTGSFVMPANNVTVAARWTQIIYSVTFTGQGFSRTVEYTHGQKLDEGTNYSRPAAQGNLPFGYWYYIEDAAEVKVAEDTVVSTLLQGDDTRSITLTAKYAIVVGKEDFSNAVDSSQGYLPEKAVCDIRAGQVVTLSGNMTSLAQENWQTVLTYLYGGAQAHGFFRFDWWVEDGTTKDQTTASNVGWDPQNITAAEGWKIAFDGVFDWPNAGSDHSHYLATIANCVFTVKIDWTYETVIKITMRTVGVDNHTAQTMYYTITPKGEAFASEVYHIGLNADLSYACFDELEIHTHDYSNGDICPADRQLNPNHGDVQKGGMAHNYVNDVCTICKAVSPDHTAHEYVDHVCTICKAVDVQALDALATQEVASYADYDPQPADAWFLHPSPAIAVEGDFTVKFSYEQGALPDPSTVIELRDNATTNLSGDAGWANYFDANPNDGGIWGTLSSLGMVTTATTGSSANVTENSGITVRVYVWRVADTLYCYYRAENAQGEAVYTWLVIESDFATDRADIGHVNVYLSGYCAGATGWNARKSA